MTISVTALTNSILQQYNAVGDSMFSDDLMRNLLWAGQMELAIKAKCIEDQFTTTTVASQTQYALPTNCMAIKWIEYNGTPLQRISDREYDALTLNNSVTTLTGTPQYFKEFDKTLWLLPTPDSAVTLRIYAFVAPTQMTASSSFEVPDEFVLDLVDYCLYRMAAMDKNFDVADRYKAYWDKKVQDAVMWARAKRRTSGFARVLDEDEINKTIIGGL